MWCPCAVKSAWVVGLVLVACAAAAVSAGRPPGTPDEGEPGRATAKVLDDREALSKKLLAVADDPERPEPERWQAVVSVGRLGTRAGLEYLVEHITLLLTPPGDRRRSEATDEDHVCYWVLTHRPAGWEGDGRNWNVAQVVLRAIGQPRTDDEVRRYARVLELSLGLTRFSDGTYSGSPRAVAVVDAEIASESVATPRADFPDGGRPTRLANLKAIRKALTEPPR
jgi:hypothetical protein